MANLRFRVASSFALSLVVPISASASCGAAFCTVNTSSAFMDDGIAGKTRVDLRFEFVDQKEPMHGNDRVRVGEISEHHDEVRTTNRNLLLGIEHELAKDWVLGLTLPLVDRSHSHIHNHHHDGDVLHLPAEWKFQEIGDMRITARHELVAGHHQAFGLTLGVKLPTGKSDIENSDGEVAERSLQPGSGTTDLLLGAHWRFELDETSRLFASVAATLSGPEHDDFRPGHRYHLDFAWQRSLGNGWSVPIQLNISRKERDKGAEAEPEDSGGTSIAISPGLSWAISPNWQVYGYWQKMLHQRVNGLQLTANWSAVVGTTYAF